MNSSDDWKSLRPLLEEALALEPAERDAYLDALPASQAALRDRLRAMLGRREHGERLLEAGAGGALSPLLGANDHVDEERVRERRIGPYRLRRLLGIGGMGMVYLADREGAFEQTVALKVLQGDLARGARERFDRERQILAGLVHPLIARLHDGGELADGQAYYTMEYVDGIPITHYCREQQLGVEQRVRLLRDVAVALGYAHGKLVVHRDIKASNILVGDDGKPKLLDFGIAKLLAGAGDELTRTSAGPMTPENAAPEQFRNETVSVATDIYQFGMLCYRVFAGALPYRAEPADTYAWARAVAEQDAMPMAKTITTETVEEYWGPRFDAAQLRRRVSGDLDAIVRKMLEKSPERRYASMDAIVAEFDALLSDRPIGARTSTRWYAARRFVSRNRYTIAAAMFVFAILVSASVITHNQAVEARSEARRAGVAIAFLADMFKGATPGSHGDTTLTAATMLQHAAGRMHELDGDADLRGAVESLLGSLYVSLGRMSVALPMLRQAITDFDTVKTHDVRLMGSTLERAAVAAHHVGEIDQALRWLDRADILLANDDRSLDDVRVGILIDRFVIDRDRDDTAAAHAHAERAVALARAIPGEAGAELYATALFRMGQVLKDENRFDEALAMLQDARTRMLAQSGPNSLRTLTVEEVMGKTYMKMRRFDDAEGLLYHSRDGTGEVAGKQSEQYGDVLFDVGVFENARNRPLDAFADFEESARIFEHAGSPKSPTRLGALFQMGNVKDQLHNTQGALAYWEQADAIAEEVLPPDSDSQIELWARLANAYAVSGQHKESADFLRRITAQAGASQRLTAAWAHKLLAEQSGDSGVARDHREKAQSLLRKADASLDLAQLAFPYAERDETTATSQAVFH